MRPGTAISVQKTQKRVLTRRGVMWLGQTCNQRCYFCYFIDRIEDRRHPQHAFMTLQKACRIADVLRHFYKNSSVDIQGGEPTVHKDILALVSHCRKIGLSPTLITNALLLAKPGVVEQYRDAGLRDFLVSLHGVGETHDEVVGVKGAYAKIDAALEHMGNAGIPVRMNCTMSKPVVPILGRVADRAIARGALAMNYIAFNPFNDQVSGRRRTDTVPRYSETMASLTDAIDRLEAAGIEVNVRYLPLCLAEPRHRKNFYNYQQLSYDIHEWDYQSWLWTMMETQMMQAEEPTQPFRLGVWSRRIYNSNAAALSRRQKERPLRQGVKFRIQRLLARLQQQALGKEAMYRQEARTRAAVDCGYKYGEACSCCHMREICDGFHGDYADFFGMEEARPIHDVPAASDPWVFIREQEKVVFPEDRSWAL